MTWCMAFEAWEDCSTGPVVWQDCSREPVVWHMETVASSHMIEPDGQASAVPKGCGLLA